MIKRIILGYLIKFLITAAALGTGIWYVSSSLNGAALTYSSLDGFMNAVGVTDGNIASANGCMMCKYINDLFVALGDGAELFWNTILDNLWILMAVGFGVFLFIHSIQYIYKAMTEAAKQDEKEKKLEFGPWFDTVWRQGVRVMIVGAIIGAFGIGGIDSLRVLADVIIRPVMLIGTELSMVATGISESAQCAFNSGADANTMSSVSNSFMCIIGNINSVMLAGSAGGFALMNYAWLGMGGGVLTWVAGLFVVIMFVIMGFDLFFQVLSVLFKLVFLIIFLPLLVAASAFEKTWKMAGKVGKGAISTLIESALKVIAITLKVVIVYAIMFFAADQNFPGPVDKYSSILPPMMGITMENPDAQTLSVANVFSKCEAESLDSDGLIDKDLFKNCFEAQKQIVEARYPGAFDFMDDGWSFMILLIGLFFVYFYVLSPKIDSLMTSVDSMIPFKSSDGKGGMDDFGGELKKYTKMAWQKPKEITDKIFNK